MKRLLRGVVGLLHCCACGPAQGWEVPAGGLVVEWGSRSQGVYTQGAGDWDGDGQTDLFVSGPYRGGSETPWLFPASAAVGVVVWGGTTGGFPITRIPDLGMSIGAPHERQGVGAAGGGDLDGDGFDDLAFISPEGVLQVLWGDGLRTSKRELDQNAPTGRYESGIHQDVWLEETVAMVVIITVTASTMSR